MNQNDEIENEFGDDVLLHTGKRSSVGDMKREELYQLVSNSLLIYTVI